MQNGNVRADDYYGLMVGIKARKFASKRAEPTEEDLRVIAKRHPTSALRMGRDSIRYVWKDTIV